MPEHEIAFRIDEPVVAVGTAALLLWLCSERLLQLVGFRQPKAERRDPFWWYCWHAPALYGALVFSLLDATMWHWTTVGPALGSVRWVGVPLVAAGILIRLLSRLALGKQFSPHVQTTPEHRLITTGIYRSIRHPAYLGYLCLLLGVPLCFGSVGGFACGLAAVPAVLYRIRIEEAALAGWFPDEYHRYQATTRKLIPGLW
jgi:protein-S-isoprenylcysteine O-methyltransferase Ste14